MSDNLQSTLAQPVVLLVVQGLWWCNDNRLTCVHTHRIKVLHVAHCNAVIVLVTYHLVLKLLPALPEVDKLTTLINIDRCSNIRFLAKNARCDIHAPIYIVSTDYNMRKNEVWNVRKYLMDACLSHTGFQKITEVGKTSFLSGVKVDTWINTTTEYCAMNARYEFNHQKANSSKVNP